MLGRTQIWDYEALAHLSRIREGMTYVAAGGTYAVPDSAMRPGETLEEWKIRNLLRGLQVLAAPPTAQIAAFPPFVDVPFEIMESFSEPYLLLREFLERGELPAKAREALAAVDQALDELSEAEDDPNHPKDLVACLSRPLWGAMRRRSKAVLELLGYPSEPPPPGSM